MHFSFNIYSEALFISASVSIILAAILFSRYKEAGRSASYLLILTAWWSFFAGICIMQTDPKWVWLFIKLQYLAITLFPAFWIVFILKFLRMETFLTPSRIVFPFLFAAVSLTLVFTNDLHHFFYKEISILKIENYFVLKSVKGPWYFIHLSYFYLCMIGGVYLLWLKADRTNPVFSKQNRTVFYGALIPFIVNLLFISGYLPKVPIDPTPLAFTLTGLILAFGLMKFDLFDLLPIAREKIIDALNVGVIVLDFQDRVVFLNPAMRQMLPETDMIGASVNTFFPKLQLSDILEQEIEIYGDTENKKVFSVSTSIVSYRKLRDKGKILLFNDITDRKQVEENIIRAKEEAIQAEKLKGEFLSTMSHEIRTPMNAVIGFTTLLLQDAREDQKEYLNLLKYSGENLLSLINDILDFSKIEAGKIELEEADFSLFDLVKRIKLTFQAQARQKDILVETVMDENLPQNIRGDSVRLGQILINLVGNAVKFTEKGQVTISVSLKEKLSGAFNIHFEVNDTGIGIPVSKQNSIFESFTQASTDTTRKFGGTGLGLAISKKLVELHGGKISLASEPCKGSSFRFDLVFRECHLNETVKKVPSETFSGSLAGTKVLLAEDNKINVLLAKKFLENWSVECEVAENGMEALAMAATNQYDIILMDLQMPQMDGFAAAEAIRALPELKYSSIPIIALTAAALQEERERVLKSGMNDIVTKPFNPKILFEKLNYYRSQANISIR